MSLWTNWSQNWYKGYQEEQLYNKQLNKAEADAGPDVEKFIKKFEELESLTPTEEPEFIAAAADMGLTDQEYISVWSQTKTPPVSYTNNRSQGVEDKTKQSYGLGPALMLKLTGNFLKMLVQLVKLQQKEQQINLVHICLEHFVYLQMVLYKVLTKEFRNYSVEYQAALEEELKKL